MKRIWSYTIQLGFHMWRDETSAPEVDAEFQCQSSGHYQQHMLTERETWRGVIDALPSFGINMLVPIFLCSFLGLFIDQKLQTSCFMVILFFVGALAGFRNVYLLAKKIYDDGGKSPYGRSRKRNKN